MGPDSALRTVALIGMMGAGKSTVGRLLAPKLGRPFYDSDAVIEEQTGKTVAQIFRDDGETAFRDLEAEAVCRAVELGDPVVLGVAGGAVMRPETRAVLRDHALVVWLRAPVETLIKRVIDRHLDRPMLGEDPEGSMRRLYEVRGPIYESIADHIIDVADATPTEVVDKIVVTIQ